MIEEMNNIENGQTDQNNTGRPEFSAVPLHNTEAQTPISSASDRQASSQETPRQPEKQKLILIIVLIAVLLGLALLYVNGFLDRFSNLKIGANSSSTRALNEASVESFSRMNSNSISVIEKDLQDTDVENLDSEVSSIEKELK